MSRWRPWDWPGSGRPLRDPLSTCMAPTVNIRVFTARTSPRASCTTIYGKDPTGFKYIPSGITPDAAAFLQRTAWQTVQDYRADRP